MRAAVGAPPRLFVSATGDSDKSVSTGHDKRRNHRSSDFQETGKLARFVFGFCGFRAQCSSLRCAPVLHVLAGANLNRFVADSRRAFVSVVFVVSFVR